MQSHVCVCTRKRPRTLLGEPSASAASCPPISWSSVRGDSVPSAKCTWGLPSIAVACSKGWGEWMGVTQGAPFSQPWPHTSPSLHHIPIPIHPMHTTKDTHPAASPAGTTASLPVVVVVVSVICVFGCVCTCGVLSQTMRCEDAWATGWAGRMASVDPIRRSIDQSG